jgi:hypothetical protein
MGLIDKVSSRLRRDAGISVERTYLYKRQASDPPAPEVSTEVDVRIAIVPPSQIEELGALGFVERDDWKQRLERGDECYGTWLGPVLVHYSWVQTQGAHPIVAAGIEAPIRPGELWIYNCRTSEAHRGLRIYPRTLQQILCDRFASGAMTAWIYTAEQNVASQRGVERVGFTRVQTLRALRLGRRYRPLACAPTQESA